MKRDQSDDFMDLKVLNHQVILNSSYIISFEMKRVLKQCMIHNFFFFYNGKKTLLEVIFCELYTC